jgi:hypothetical protein
MHDGCALVLHVVEPGPFGDCAGLRGNDPELKPQRLGAGGDRFLGHNGAELGAAKDVDDVDRLLDFGYGAGARDPEHLRNVGPHRDHVVTLLEQVTHDAVARPPGFRGGADDDNCVRFGQYVGG